MHPITLTSGRLVVPDDPIIPFIEGDGTGPDMGMGSSMLDMVPAGAVDSSDVTMPQVDPEPESGGDYDGGEGAPGDSE